MALDIRSLAQHVKCTVLALRLWHTDPTATDPVDKLHNLKYLERCGIYMSTGSILEAV